MPRNDSLDIETGPVLLLAIRPEFADRILQGKKRFELRKRLPKRRFHRVYLYVSGGAGVVGCFDVASVRTMSIDDLWRDVGAQATNENRFYKYFRESPSGSAIEVKDPIRFRRPLYLPDLKRLERKFIVPQSFIYLSPSQQLYRELEVRRNEALKGPDISLRPMNRYESKDYVALVNQVIAPRYDDITPAFANNLVRVHFKGRDADGILTTRKEILTIIHSDHGVIGYTTLTYKLGHSIKTGPTIIKSEFQCKGFGLQTRGALEDYARAQHRYKIYCTCPDNELLLVRHFLKAGYRIEGHLAAHYQLLRGELILGKVLEHAVEAVLPREGAKATRATVADSSSLRRGILARAVQRFFGATWFDPPSDFGRRMARAASRRESVPFEQKPVRIICLQAKGRCVGLVLLASKRGGAVKALLLLGTTHKASIGELIGVAERQVKQAGRRKLYFVHPLNDPRVQTILIQQGYRVEAALEQPYRIGQDALVFTKFV
jgi:predicted transcriptional regulator